MARAYRRVSPAGPWGPMQPVTMGVARVWEAAMAREASSVVLGVNANIGELARVTLDPDGERVPGEPVTVHTGSDPFVEIDPLGRRKSGSRSELWGAREHVMTVRSDGSERRKLTDDRHRNRGPRWSPDGEWLVIYSNRGGEYQIWALRPDGTGLRQLTDGSGGIFDPVWSPDGRRLAASYGHESDLAMGLLDLPADGIDGVQEIPEFRKPSGAIGFFAESWSPDGRHLVGAVSLDAAVYSIAEDRIELLRDPGRNAHRICRGERRMDRREQNRRRGSEQREGLCSRLEIGSLACLAGHPRAGRLHHR